MTYEKTKISQEDIDQMEEGSVQRKQAEETNRLIDEHNKQEGVDVIAPETTDEEKPEDTSPEIDPENKGEPEVEDKEEKVDEGSELANLKEQFKKLEQQHKTLQGMWRDKDLVTALQSENKELKRIAAQTQKQSIKKREPTSIQVAGIPPELLERLNKGGYEQKDVEAIVEAVLTQVQPKLDHVEAKTDKTAEVSAKTAEVSAESQADTLKLRMDSYIPGWRGLEKHEKFPEYIQGYLDHTTTPRQTALANAFYKGDLDTMKGIYDEFQSLYIKEAPPATEKPALPKPVIEPVSGRAPSPNLKGKKEYKRSELANLFNKAGEMKASADPEVKAKGDALYKDLGRPKHMTGWLNKLNILT